MRIAMLAACPFPWPRGTPIRIHRMAEALSQAGHDVHVITYHLGTRSARLPFTVHRIRDVPAYTNVGPGPNFRKLAQLDPLLIGTLNRVLRGGQFDIVHAHHYEGLIAALVCPAVTRLRLPIVYDAHTLLASELPYYRLGLTRGLKGFIGRQMDSRLPPRADHVIAVTETIRNALVRGGRIHDTRVSVIPNGVETAHFAAEPPPTQPTACAVLMFAGNLAPYQGIEMLLTSFAALRRQATEARLTLLTESEFAPYESLATELGIRAAIDIANPDYESLPRHLQRADVLLNPRPPCEGLPQKLLNYMAAGRPIVSYAGSAKIVEHEKTALVVPDGDADAFAAAALRLLWQPELGRRLGDNARRLVAARYGWDQVAGKVVAVYRGVLDGNLQTVRP